MYSTAAPDTLCTYNKDGLMKTAAKRRNCKDTQPSVILNKAGVYEMFNFNVSSSATAAAAATTAATTTTASPFPLSSSLFPACL
jgi:hypothetical protein